MSAIDQTTPRIVFGGEDECQALEAFLAERVYEFNAETTGYFDGKLLGGSIRSDSGEILAAVSGHTWGGCCEITYLWVQQAHRGLGFGQALMQATEREAVRRGCEQMVLSTHSFQAPEFYERLGYLKQAIIHGRPKGHSNIVYRKRLAAENSV
jgi:ribosomal protein S18 acetylase RimI-like enzyme